MVWVSQNQSRQNGQLEQRKYNKEPMKMRVRIKQTTLPAKNREWPN